MSVYVLGAGGVGTLIAASLSKTNPVNFIVRNTAKLAHLKNTNNTFHVTKLFDGNKRLEYQINGAFPAEMIPDKKIDFLIISVKTFDTVKSLTPLLSRIDSSTRILLVQNGMGVVDELYSNVWKDISTRPIIYQGVISHGVWQAADETDTYNYMHAGYGDLKICQVPRDLKNITCDDDKSIKHDEVIKTLQSSDINAVMYSYGELLVYQIQKFLVNSCMNPVTSIVDTINHGLAPLSQTTDLFTSIVSESLDILYKAYPVLNNSPLAKKLLTTEKVVEFVKHVGFGINGKNSTSMRQDVLNLRNVEIQYINGHTVKKAAEIGMSAPVNQTICSLVEIKLAVMRRVAEEKK